MWVKNSHYGWISAIVILGFTAAGIFILIMGFSGQTDAISPILSDPVLETKLLGIFFILCPWLGLGILNLWIRTQNRREMLIQEDGIEKQAVLLDYRETGTYINDAPKLLFLIEIREPDGSVSTREVKDVTSLVRIAQLKKGMTLKIHESPKGIVLHWPD